MRRRGIPIGYIGLMIVLFAFIAWYGWSTQVAPYVQPNTQRQEAQASTPSPTAAPSEAEVKAMLEKNKQSMQVKPQYAPQLPAPKSPTKVEPPKVDPTRDVMDYWWEMKPESGKR